MSQSSSFETKIDEMERIGSQLREMFVDMSWCTQGFAGGLALEAKLKQLRTQAEGLEHTVTEADLKTVMKKRKLKTTGNKDDLLHRLYSHAEDPRT